jgi:hypothetical protein
MRLGVGFSETYQLQNVWIDGNLDSFYTLYNDTNGLQVYYAKSDVRYALYLQFNESITRISLNNTILTGDFAGDSLICKFNNQSAELAIVLGFGRPVFALSVNSQNSFIFDPEGLTLPPPPPPPPPPPAPIPTAEPTYDFPYWDVVLGTDSNGTSVMFANDDKEFALFVNGTRAIESINVDTYYVITENLEGGDHYWKISENRMNIEMKFDRSLNFCQDNKFRLVIKYSSGEISILTFNVRPRSSSGAYEITADMNKFFKTIFDIIFNGWSAGLIWFFAAFSLWRISQRPWFYISESDISRKAKCIGKIISFEQSKKVPGYYRYLFKDNTQIVEFYCQENYDTLKTQVSFEKFMIYFEKYPDLVPAKLQIPKERQWSKTAVRKCIKNYVVRFFKIITTPIPSTHLAMWIESLYKLETLTEKVTEVDYLVIDFMEDRLTTVFDVSYEEFVLNPIDNIMNWSSIIERKELNYSQVRDLKSRLITGKESEFKLGAIRNFKMTPEKHIHEQYANLRDAVKDRASRIQMKVIYDAKMLVLEQKVDQTNKLYTDSQEVLQKTKLNYQIELQDALTKARQELEHNNQNLPQIVGKIMGKVSGGRKYERALEEGLEENLDATRERETAQYKRELETKQKALETAMKRIEALESKITLKHPNDLSLSDINTLAGEGQTNEPTKQS